MGSGLPEQVLVLVPIVGHDIDRRIELARPAGVEVIPLLHLSVSRTTDRRHPWCATFEFAEVIENAHNHGALGDEGDQAHAATAASAA